MSMNGTLPTPEDIKRVKGLGFLHDKTTADCFNARVITRNGRLQPDEIRAIVDAAEKFGSGEIAMTTRLTIEVQRIPFANIEPFCAFLAEHGLETGGTGPKVRPVVACKGTTLQYGLIDTVAFSRTSTSASTRAGTTSDCRTSSRSPSAAARTTASSPI